MSVFPGDQDPGSTGSGSRSERCSPGAQPDLDARQGLRRLAETIPRQRRIESRQAERHDAGQLHARRFERHLPGSSDTVARVLADKPDHSPHVVDFLIDDPREGFAGPREQRGLDHLKAVGARSPGTVVVLIDDREGCGVQVRRANPVLELEQVLDAFVGRGCGGRRAARLRGRVAAAAPPAWLGRCRASRDAGRTRSRTQPAGRRRGVIGEVRPGRRERRSQAG
jgi:hypothetical protein